METNAPEDRYRRQTAFPALGQEGQASLSRAKVAIVGVGGLGSSLAELLCRAGVGKLRLIDGDVAQWDNLHRQHLYTERHATDSTPKVLAAADVLLSLNKDVAVEAVVARLDTSNAADLLVDADLVLDGTDHPPTRFIINDACIWQGTPWIYAGAVADRVVTMNILPGRTPCLRCVFEEPPDTWQTCRDAGVIAPAVWTVTGIQACEAMKILLGQWQAVRKSILSISLWDYSMRELTLSPDSINSGCICRRW